jgi:hypothetical protein
LAIVCFEPPDERVSNFKPLNESVQNLFISTSVNNPILRSNFTDETVWICWRWNAPGRRNGFGIDSSHRLPRNAVVCRRSVTKSNSSSAGDSVSARAGRIFGHPKIDDPHVTAID